MKFESDRLNFDDKIMMLKSDNTDLNDHDSHDYEN